MRIFILTLAFAIAASAQPASANGDFAAKNMAASLAYKNGKLDSALKLTLEALSLGERTLGKDSPEVGAVYSNLGVIYRDKQDYSDAIKSFQQALAIFERIGKTFAPQVVTTHEAIGVTYRMAGKKDEAEKEFLKAIELAERSFGTDSVQLYSPYFSLAKYYSYYGNFERGDEYYLKAYRIAYLKKGKRAQELSAIEDSRTCLVLPQNPDSARSEKFDRAIESMRESLGDRAPTTIPRVIKGGVVNGKAVSLVSPSYPPMMLASNRIGAVVVRVLIDTEGNVVEAKASCGHPDFAQNSVKAALKSKFTPTLLDGQAVQVSGLIVYNFVRN